MLKFSRMTFASMYLIVFLPTLSSCKTEMPTNKLKSNSVDEVPQPIPSPTISQSFQSYLNIVGQVGKKASLTHSEISRVYQTAIEHPVARLDVLSKYDPDGIIGFCFGRSMTAHLVARNIGLKTESVGKLFVMGDLRSAGHSAAYPEWYFHVTAIVKGPDKSWYAIDPIMHTQGTPFKPLTVQQWMATVTRGWDATHGRLASAKFYFINADAILPDIRDLPDFDQETGEQLIETIFDPSKHEIAAATDWIKKLKLDTQISKRSFLITDQQMTQHFLHATPDSETTFDFEKVNVGPTVISYNNYFADLLASSLDPIAASMDPKTLNQGDLSLAKQVSGLEIPPPSTWKGGLRVRGNAQH